MEVECRSIVRPSPAGPHPLTGTPRQNLYPGPRLPLVRLSYFTESPSRRPKLSQIANSTIPLVKFDFANNGEPQRSSGTADAADCQPREPSS
jgi:hypothetical protein